MHISFFDNFAFPLKENFTLKTGKKQKDDTSGENTQNNANANSSDENTKISLVDDISELNFAEKAKSTKASQEKSELEELLEMFYEKLEKLKEELNEINVKISEATDEELKLELLSQAQNIITQIQVTMAQIIKILREMLEQQGQQKRLDTKA